MSETFTKLFGSILHSTIWCESMETKIVWITMLALADRHGYVGASVPGLAAAAGVSVEKTREALEKFMSPDPDSRSQEYEGRRVELADRGFTVLNYERFRDMHDEDVRREYERDRKRRQRAAAKTEAVPVVPHLSGTVTRCPAPSAQAEADTDTEARRERVRTPDDFDRFWSAYPKKRAKGDARKAWIQTKAARPDVESILAKLAALVVSRDWGEDGGKFIPYPASWLRAEGWNDEPATPRVEQALTYDQLRERQEYGRWR